LSGKKRPQRADEHHPQADVACGAGIPQLADGDRDLAHDPEKWEPVFGKDHAQAKC
jgi:hypothetical protein